MEITNMETNMTKSRRSFFTQTAVLFGATAVATKILDAQQTTPTTVTDSDVDILNYALALEHLEAAFYVQGVARYTAGDFNNRADSNVFGSKVNNNIVTYLLAIRDHEVAHVAAISATIRQLGGTPVAPCTYNFGVNNVNDYLMVAMALENTGVMAYDGAIALISNPDVKQAAATIAMVEGRHASYLNVLNNQIPFPAAFDTPKSRAEVLAIAGQFITSCPGGGPTSNPAGPVINGLRTTITTTEADFQFNFASSAAQDGSAVSFQFTQISGPRASILADRSSAPRVLFLGGKGQYVFELVIMDGRGGTQRGRTTVNYV
jgi:rubrerythrin